MGFEPTTASLEGWNSTTELRPPTVNLPIIHGLPAVSPRTSPRFASPDTHEPHSAQAELIQVLVGRQGFEPWKPSGSRFTVCPLCPLGYLPVSHNSHTKQRPLPRQVSNRSDFIPLESENESKPHHAQLPSKTTGLGY